jgi:hypothetical protein
MSLEENEITASFCVNKTLGDPGAKNRATGALWPRFSSKDNGMDAGAVRPMAGRNTRAAQNFMSHHSVQYLVPGKQPMNTVIIKQWVADRVLFSRIRRTDVRPI